MTVTTSKPEKILYTVPELMEIMSLPRPTAYRLVADGTIKSLRIGRSIRIHKDDVVRFIEEHRTGGEAA